jgi:hypothetical protein
MSGRAKDRLLIGDPLLALLVLAFAGGLTVLGALWYWTAGLPPGDGQGPLGAAYQGRSEAACSPWADPSRSDLRLLRRAIRRGWPVLQEPLGPRRLGGCGQRLTSLRRSSSARLPAHLSSDFLLAKPRS